MIHLIHKEGGRIEQSKLSDLERGDFVAVIDFQEIMQINMWSTFWRVFLDWSHTLDSIRFTDYILVAISMTLCTRFSHPQFDQIYWLDLTNFNMASWHFQ